MKRYIAFFIALALMFAAGCGKQWENGYSPSLTETGKLPTDAAEENGTDIQAKFLVCKANYPETVKYPSAEDYGEDYEAFCEACDKWAQARLERSAYSAENAEGLCSFTENLFREMTDGADGENTVFSPLNIYIALAMLAEATDGDTRGQILDVLGAGSVTELRRQVKALWEANYADDGSTSCILADSLWLSDSLNYKDGLLQTLAQSYYASAFTGTPGSPDYDKAIQSWLNEQTGGLLKDSAEKIRFNPQTVLALASSVYFNARWSDEFSAAATALDTFISQNGDVTCEFMHGTQTGGYYKGEKFSEFTKSFFNSTGMRFILPDSEVSLGELFGSEEFLRRLTKGANGDELETRLVNISVPKFDVTEETDLIPKLQDLGIKDAFGRNSADFSPLTDDCDDLFVSQIQHCARVLVDEEGCTAAAFTVEMTEGTGMRTDEPIDFTLDRPFVFIINGADDLPLFIGIVNHP